ncbi:hypothetical protein CRG98_013297 [Punica granatum]|uniref:Uncharacterized protein n=1 Tax=Punica granatum TaxID=22663 RepID=A0A2I0KCS5_PUNGR|nr:hypothetical protein CRG98_013297 [Punica granatum]
MKTGASLSNIHADKEVGKNPPIKKRRERKEAKKPANKENEAKSRFTKSTDAADPKEINKPRQRGSSRYNSSTETEHNTLRGVNQCILLACGNVLPMLSLFSRSIHNYKRVIASLQSATTESKSQTFLYESLVITLQKWLDRGLIKSGQKSPEVTNATALRRSTLELEFFIARLGHPQQTTTAPRQDWPPTNQRLPNCTQPNHPSRHPSHVTTGKQRLPLRYRNIVYIYRFLDFGSTYTAFRTSRPHLRFSGLRVHTIAFQTSRPHILLFRTSRLQLRLFGLRVHIYCFPDFASSFTAFWTSYPHLRLSGLRVQMYYFSDFMFAFTAFRTSHSHLMLFRTSRPHLWLSGLCVHIYLLSRLRVRIYCFPDFVSISTTFRTSRPNLLLFGLHVRIYCFSDFASTCTDFRTSRPHLLLYGPRPLIYRYTGLGPAFIYLSYEFTLSHFLAVIPLPLFLATGPCICIILSYISKTREQAATRRESRRSQKPNGVLLIVFGCILKPSTQLERGKMSAPHFGPPTPRAKSLFRHH